MNRLSKIAGLFTAVCTLSSLHAVALHPREMPDSFPIPQRAVVATGDPEQAGALVAVLYDTHDLHYADPSAPRFLFFDRKGKVALGIGGYIKGTM